MTTKGEAAAAERKVETRAAMGRRHEAQIARAFGVNMTDGLDYRMIRAAIYAVVPGRQNAKNIRDLLDAGVTAACRVIRRGSR